MKSLKNKLLSWKRKKLGNCGTIQSGGTPDTNKTDYWQGTIPWITPSEVTGLSKKFVQKTERYLTEKGLKDSSAVLLPSNSLIICTRATVGNSCINVVPMCTNQGFKNLIPNSENDVLFLYYLIENNKKDLIRKACGSTFLEISKKDIVNLSFLMPPTRNEQEKIVEVLECWYKGIDLVKKLIEQKELQKKYLMQQLLSGTRRLKGFTQKWEKKPLGKLIKLYQGYPFKSETYSAQGQYKIITIANVKQGYLDLAKFSTIQILPPDILKYQQLDIGDILISMTGNVGRICQVNSKNCLLNQRVGKIEANLLDKEFLYYILQLPNFLNVMFACAQGGAQANLSTKDIYHYVLFYPSDTCEQQAIAEVLSSADKEIDLLKQKLAKLEAQKKGLMQVLLTGKVRLK
ncbi:restriction endonuclease subunit S [Candidatus Avelusimicrobium stercoris]|uniref:restriction endonuclease subunit S n=1 Tax=Candidatus Avelusimicrobium stercoris TaxID=1947924 RepID=UPI003D10B96B